MPDMADWRHAIYRRVHIGTYWLGFEGFLINALLVFFFFAEIGGVLILHVHCSSIAIATDTLEPLGNLEHPTAST